MKYSLHAYCKQEKPNQTTSKLPYKDLIVFLVGFLGEEPGFLELVLQGVHTLFIGQRPVLEDLTGAEPRNTTLVHDRMVS